MLKVQLFCETRYDANRYTQIEAFPEEISKSLYLLLHLDIYHNMATQCCHYLSLWVFCDMTGIYTSVYLHSLLHVVSILIQQSLKSHSQLSYKVDTYFSQHFCCNAHVQNFVIVVCNKCCICAFCYLGYLLFVALCVSVMHICAYQPNTSLQLSFHKLCMSVGIPAK